jgi:hypothetical protein
VLLRESYEIHKYSLGGKHSAASAGSETVYLRFSRYIDFLITLLLSLIPSTQKFYFLLSLFVPWAYVLRFREALVHSCLGLYQLVSLAGWSVSPFWAQ